MSWFGTKVELEVVGSDGKPHKVKIPERQFKQWAAEGKIRRADCQVHILDPMRSERLETWKIGADVDQETYDRSKDVDGHLYALVHYAEGQRSQYIVAKGIWEKAKREVFSTPNPSSFQEGFEEQHKKLLSADLHVQTAAAVTMNTLWRGFNAEYHDLVSFRDADEAEKADYLHKLSDMVKKMTSDEMAGKTPEGTYRGAFLVLLYLTAVARDDGAMVTRIADALEPFNKMAYEMLRDSEQ